MKIMYIAGFKGNIGDIINHSGFYGLNLYNKNLFEKNSFGQWRLKPEFMEERREPKWD